MKYRLNEEGNVMLLALMSLLIISVLSTAVLAVAGLESRIASNDKRAHQALQAANAGLEVARNIIIEEISKGTAIDDGSNNDIESLLSNLTIPVADDLEAQCQIIKANDYAKTGELTLKAMGNYKGIKKEVQATMAFNNIPTSPIKTNHLKVAGQYNEEITKLDWVWDSVNWGWEIETSYTPWGKMISNAPLAYKTITTAENTANYHNTELVDLELAMLWPKRSLYRPPKILDSNDFITASSVPNPTPPVSFTEDDVEIFYKTALANPDDWQIWEEGSFDINLVTKSGNYIKGNSDELIDIEIRNNFWTRLLGSSYVNKDLPQIIMVSNAKLNVKLNGDEIELDEGCIYLLSSSGINIDSRYEWFDGFLGIKDRNANHHVKTFALTDKNINMDSYIKDLSITGSLQASNRLTAIISDEGIDWNVFDGSNENQIFMNEVDSRLLIDSFPYRWSLLGIGRVTSYEEK